MFSHKVPDDGTPCPQMKGLVSGLSDGALTGLGRWYAEHHTAHCPRCAAALTSLVVIKTRLRATVLNDDDQFDEKTPPLTPERRVVVEVEMDRIDALYVETR